MSASAERSLGQGYKQNKLAAARDLAVDVIDQNTYYSIRNNGTGDRLYTWTVPSKEFYVHQWNWDACTIAMGMATVDPERAQEELITLTAGQWDNGNIGAITYNPEETKYYSKSDNWKTDAFAQGDFKSTGISNPPLLGIAVEHIYNNTPDSASAEAFADAIVPKVKKFHEFLKESKDAEDSGLLTYVHPWETGADNSPRWDGPLERILISDIPTSVIDDVNTNRTDIKFGKVSNRPRQEEYYRYMHLVDLYNKWGWDFEKIAKDSPFAVKDILSSSLWARANESLAKMLDKKGDPDAQKYRDWSAQTKEALAGTWSEEYQQYCDIDVSQGRHEPIVKATNAIFTPLYAGAVTDEQMPKVIARLADPSQFWSEYPIPSTALNSLGEPPQAYWRRPSWLITNVFGIVGLDRNRDAHADAAWMRDDLVDRTLHMVADNGFYENYDPERGNPKPGQESRAVQTGFGNFSWTAGSYLYLHDRYQRETREEMRIKPKDIVSFRG